MERGNIYSRSFLDFIPTNNYRFDHVSLYHSHPILEQTENKMPIYLSMQRVRFSSPDAYEKFKVYLESVMVCIG